MHGWRDSMYFGMGIMHKRRTPCKDALMGRVVPLKGPLAAVEGGSFFASACMVGSADGAAPLSVSTNGVLPQHKGVVMHTPTVAGWKHTKEGSTSCNLRGLWSVFWLTSKPAYVCRSGGHSIVCALQNPCWVSLIWVWALNHGSLSNYSDACMIHNLYLCGCMRKHLVSLSLCLPFAWEVGATFLGSGCSGPVFGITQ